MSSAAAPSASSRSLVRVGTRMRPRFTLVAACGPDEAVQRIRRTLRRPDPPFRAKVFERHLVLKVPEQELHFWSPQLTLDVEPHADGCLLRGLYGPHPSIWSLFVAAYVFLGFGGTTGLLFGYSQWTLAMPPTALWSVPAALVLAAVVYGIALVGRRLGTSQMIALRADLEHVLHAAARTAEPAEHGRA